MADLNNLTTLPAQAIVADSRDTFAFENVAAKLIPFDMKNTNGSSTDQSGPLGPIISTGGLVFPFNPAISEGINVSYDPMKVIHSNESYYVYQSTENQQITMSDCVWVADTFQNARYALAVIHFFRSYSMMDFGRGRTGRPPQPMWLSAYGHYGFDRIPVLMTKADWSWPSNEEMDYVGIPEPGSVEWNQCKLATRRNANNSSYTWIPVKFKVNSISLIVQHSPRYWIGYSLDDYRSGKMLKDRTGFHIDPAPPSGPLSSSTTATPATTSPNTPVQDTTPEQPYQTPTYVFGA